MLACTAPSTDVKSLFNASLLMFRQEVTACIKAAKPEPASG
jgi:hypothetical protein